MTSFADLGLSEEVLRAVTDAGYQSPTPIQAQAIPHVLMGRDVLGTAQTGTGKTAGFTLPLIDILAGGRVRARMPRALILEPTRELADQVAKSFDTYGKYNKLSMALLIGGVAYEGQEKLLDRGVDVLIATPGRLLDHFERGRIMLTDTKVLVIDEADRMLDMGFMPDVEKIVGLLPPLRQTLFFSATMPPEMRRLADKFLSNPREVAVAATSSAATTVTQGLLRIKSGGWTKRETLRRLLAVEDVKNAIIFCNRKRDVDYLAKSLVKHGASAAALHGDMSQEARMETLERFKQNEIRLLVASDVAARGLDVQGLSHVFNFDVPFHAEDYVHRIGRTGRAGQSGKAYTIATPDDDKFLAAIEQMLGRSIPAAEVPGGEPEASNEIENRGPRRGSRDRGRPRRDGSRNDGPRGRDRAPRREHSFEPQQAVESAPPTDDIVAQAPMTQPAFVEQPVVAEAAPNVVELAEHRPQRSQRPPRRSRNSDDADGNDAVLGLGDHVPAFLMTPTNVGRG